MLTHIAVVALGGALLFYGAEWLVKGASGLASRFGVSPLVIGLTVVSLGTSAPEGAVSVVAALRGESGIAMGNVIGSNITNIGVVLGLTALIAPPRVPAGLWRSELPWLIGSTLALLAVLASGTIDRLEGALFLGAAALFTVLAVRQQRRASGASDHKAAEPGFGEGEAAAAEASTALGASVAGRSGALLAIWTLGGLAGLVVGARLFVESAAFIARAVGVDERTIGLTLVAVGTSLPELAASLVAALRGHSDLAVGNVVGSNLANVLLIVGATAAARPIAASLGELQLELMVLVAFTLALTASLVRLRRVTRIEGGAYLGAYIAFLIALF